MWVELLSNMATMVESNTICKFWLDALAKLPTIS